jgi:O-antigen ligase
MATLLVICIPMLFALVADLGSKAQNPRAGSGVLLLAVAGTLVLLVGIFLNGSLAVLLLGLPVVMISAAILIPEGMRLRGAALALALVSIAAILTVYLTPLQDKLLASNATSFETRQTMWSNTMPAIKDQGLLGSGVGSYPKLYPQYEDQSAVDTTYVNHAHNDYLEIAVEAGVPGLLLLVAFLYWWGNRAAWVWRSAAADRYAGAATIASAAMLIHSLVDYPLRTATLSAIMAACVATMARPRLRDHGESDDLWPATRHLTV